MAYARMPIGLLKPHDDAHLITCYPGQLVALTDETFEPRWGWKPLTWERRAWREVGRTRVWNEWSTVATGGLVATWREGGPDCRIDRWMTGRGEWKLLDDSFYVHGATTSLTLTLSYPGMFWGEVIK